MLLHHFLKFVLLILIPVFLSGQTPAGVRRVPGQVLVSLQAGEDVFDFLEKHPQFQQAQATFPALNIWQLHFDENVLPAAEMLDFLRQQPEIRLAQWNFWLENRSAPPHNPPEMMLPDDPDFHLQWYLKSASGVDLGAEAAWNITTGGVTPAGDTVVVAVLDAGFDWSQPDFWGNRWKNRAEIADDGIDNDGNGFVDDVLGWNFWTHNDSPQGYDNAHGNAVAGIFGARSNNSLGIAGINWRVKIMPIVCPNHQAGILAAYHYALKMRLLYHQSGGKLGAFVVATNTSWGVNYGKPADAPLWCEVYDLLGAEGILNVAATANLGIDVDVHGDLPTTCPSDFLLTVTSVDSNDQRLATAAFGSQNIDLAAFGNNIYTLLTGNSRGFRSGNSFAAPQVTGAIALLYSAPCPNLIAKAKIDPAAAALDVRDLLLKNTLPNTSLAGKTTSGGRLSLNKLLENYEAKCTPCPPPFGIKMLERNDSSMLLDWSQMPDFQSVNLKYRKLGSGSMWSNFQNVVPPFRLAHLQPCTEYELKWRAACPSQQSQWSEAVTFRTDGCCEAPEISRCTPFPNGKVKVEWSKITAAQQYLLQWRPLGTNSWIGDTLITNESFIIKNLPSCTDFELRVGAKCQNAAQIFFDEIAFQTKGCGACEDQNYCAAAANDALFSWISTVKIGNWQHQASYGGAGFEYFSLAEQSDTLRLGTQKNYPLTLTPAFVGSSTQVYFKIFADLNFDGDFSDANECLFDPLFSHNASISGNIQLPNLLPNGITRLRVVMKKYSNLDAPPTDCGNFQSGQVKDFCILLADDLVKSEALPTQNDNIRVFPNPTTGSVAVTFSNPSSAFFSWKIIDFQGMVRQQGLFHATTASQFLQLDDLPSGMYFFEIKSEKQQFLHRLMKF